ncbi:ketopantoate reductase family protein [Lacibacterium aquatile]|uniref:2-dehydropantoate 2-reductase n=1 Tax=Lacibacterium aquatile TaxID=1168082 RepID=A0ABW5DW75_9PROT
MRVIVMGSGGIGGYFGARLVKVGAEVTFLARGQHLAAMQQNGLRINSKIDGTWTLPVKAVADLSGEAPADIVLFCVKSYDTETAIETIRPVISPHTGIISLQNGMGNEEKLAAAFGEDRVIGGICYIFANITEPGVIAHHQLSKIVFGDWTATTSDRCQRFLALCGAAGFEAVHSTDVRKTLWEKYVFLTAMAGTTALTRQPAGTVQQQPAVEALFLGQLDELLALAAASKIGLDADMRERCRSFLAGLAPGNYSSLYLDLAQGNRLELEALHGHAVRLGRRLSVPTPMLDAVYGGLYPYKDGAPAK